MAAYDYRCERDGVFELTMPLGTAPSAAPCPDCGEEAPRIFSAPLTAAPSIDRSGPFGMTPIPPPPGRGGPPGGRPPMSQLPLTGPMRNMMPRP